MYPNFDEIPKYTGYLKPKNFEIFRETLESHGILDARERVSLGVEELFRDRA